jgi:hypothetical protein
MRTTAILLVVASLWHPARLSAQGLEHAQVEGRVVDGSGAAIVGAAVTLEGGIGGPQRVSSDGVGAFRFLRLLSGDYVVRAEAAGLTPARRAIAVPLAATLRVDLVLSVPGIAETVDVTARSPVVDVRSPAIVTTVDERTLQTLPVRRALGEVLALVPGISNPTFVPGLVVAYGGTLGSNALYLDGVDATDPRRQAALLEVNYNWLEQMQVVAFGAGAQYGDSTGVTGLGLIRAGGNRFSGLTEYWTTRWDWIDRNGSSLAGRQLESLWDSTAQVGGPLRRDRAWFFTGLEVYRHADRPQNYGGADRASEHTPRAIAKLTLAPAADARLEGHVQWNGRERTAASAGPSRAPEALSTITQRDLAWNLRVTKPLGATLVEARTGGYDSDYADLPQAQSLEGPPSRIDTRTGLATVNSPSYRRVAATQGSAMLALTRVAGAHDAGLGVDVRWSRSLVEDGFPGAEQISTANGIPVVARVWAGDALRAGGRRVTVHGRDRWRLGERLTLEAGLRLDLNSGSTPDGGVVFRTTPLSPRLGLSWALDAEGRSVLKASAGRYADTLFLERVAFMDIPGVQPMRLFSYDVAGNRVFVRESAPATARGIDPDIRHSHVDQAVVGYEREIAAHTVLQAAYVARRFDDFMAMTETQLDWAPVTLVDPGIDGREGTDDDGAPFTAYRQVNPDNRFLWLTNPPDAVRRYDGLQAVVRRRFAGGWQGQASYTWSRTAGTMTNGDFVNAGLNEAGEATGTLTAGKFLNPNGAINNEGRAQFDVREFKAHGAYTLDRLGGFVVSGIAQHRSGNRWQRQVTYFDVLIPGDFQTVLLEPRGSRSTSGWWNLDLRVEKTLYRRTGGPSASVAFDVFNATNQGTVLAVFPVVGGNFGMPLTRSDPRQLRLLLRATF